MGEAVKRITAVLNSKDESVAPYDLYEATVRRSFVLSSDQAHALHPNYASKHEKNHQPQMNAGMVIKRNSNQRYATTAATGILMREIARRSNLPPIQEFIVRQDCGCVRIFMISLTMWRRSASFVLVSPTSTLTCCFAHVCFSLLCLGFDDWSVDQLSNRYSSHRYGDATIVYAFDSRNDGNM